MVLEGESAPSVADTTYLKVRSGWMYLATVMDLYRRRIVGWSLSARNDTQLISQALENAHQTRGPVKEGIIHHSDRGSTYASDGYQKENCWGRCRRFARMRPVVPVRFGWKVLAIPFRTGNKRRTFAPR